MHPKLYHTSIRGNIARSILADANVRDYLIVSFDGATRVTYEKFRGKGNYDRVVVVGKLGRRVIPGTEICMKKKLSGLRAKNYVLYTRRNLYPVYSD